MTVVKATKINILSLIDASSETSENGTYLK